MVEVFRDPQSGSGLVEIDSLPGVYGWKTSVVHPDLAMLRQLSLLPSYDVYTLRISLREQGVGINAQTPLRLSEEKERQLRAYMQAFTRPLVKLVYADEDLPVGSYGDIIHMFNDPDVAKARQRLIRMAKNLNIEPTEVPKFVEDVGDTFLCLSYYQHCLDRLEPYFSACIESLGPIRSHFQLRHDQNLMRNCDIVEHSINAVTAAVTGHLEVFGRRTREMWMHVTQEEFQQVRTLIERYHVTLGGALCALTVKMNAFARNFPRPSLGSPMRFADFVMTEMVQGIDVIRTIQGNFQQKSGSRPAPRR
jgi:hypothetical protein